MRNVNSYKPEKSKRQKANLPHGQNIFKKIDFKKFGIKNNPHFIIKTCFYSLTSFILIATIIYSTYNIVKWKAESDVLSEQISSVQEMASKTELSTDISQEVKKSSIQADDPYWRYIKTPLLNVDLKDLKSTNSDTVGWIELPGTNINYSFVHTTDNDFYLTHSFNKAWNSAGWLFLDYQNTANFNNKNQIIYGHGRNDGTMFGSLKNLLSEEWQNNIDNHIIKTSTETQNTIWQIFSAYRIQNTTDYLAIDFNSKDDFMNYVNMVKNRSVYDFKATINEDDKLLTLSTCIGTNERMVVHAKLIKSMLK